MRKRITVRCPTYDPNKPIAERPVCCTGCDGLLVASKVPKKSFQELLGNYVIHCRSNPGGLSRDRILEGMCLQIMGATEPGFLKEAEEVAV